LKIVLLINELTYSNSGLICLKVRVRRTCSNT